MTPVRVYIADDHPVVRSGLRGMIDGQPDLSVVGDAFDGETAVRDAARLRPDVVVMDVSMPGIGGVEATVRIRRDCPEVRVVALTAHADRGYLQQLLAAGASGYVLKRSAADDLVRAIRCAAAGQMYLDPAVAGQVVPGPAAGPAADPAADLSDREAEVVRLIAEGYGNKQIAARLAVSVKTIETAKARALEKLGLESRVDIIRYAVGRGWLPGG
ncbi:MAG TPA: response regulator transcription factor [Gemmataceae bacterium]|jgi:DNA-binding NarL/FixJ family response regulator|nr:response regulator transcription factor [Gemmataceae bacterium]